MTEEEREQYLMLAKLLAGGFGIVVLALNTHGAPVRMPGFTIHIPLLLLLALSLIHI